jgi:hypothetical protein
MPGTSTPLTPTQIRAALTKFKCKVRFIDGWETRNRGNLGNGFGPVYGFIVHHTGDDAPDTADRNIIIHGRSDLPGPLAQFGLNDDGTVDVIGCGRANHAGTGDPNVLAAVRDETYVDYPPKPTLKGYDGNGRFYGVETYYSGSHVPAQYDAMVNLAAAICDAHGWTAKSVIGHKEWSYTKPDPGSVDMAKFRRDVNARIAAVNAPKPPPVPAAAATTTTLVITPTVTSRGGFSKLAAVTNRAGTHVFEYLPPGTTTWREFARRVTTSGRSELFWPFGATHGVRVRFVPAVPTKLRASVSGTVKVTTVALPK